MRQDAEIRPVAYERSVQQTGSKGGKLFLHLVYAESGDNGISWNE